jgi:hypothetical protein
LDYPWGVAVDTNWIYVANYFGKVLAFPINTVGNVAPARSIHGDLTSLFNPAGIAIDSRVVCPRSISPTERSHGIGAETGTVDVTAPAGCDWTATSNNAWITVTSGDSGNGNGMVSYSVSANPGAGSRTGTLTIAGKTFTVTQSGTVVSPITLTSPADQAPFTGCSLYSLPTFAWSATETYKSFEVQFSPSEDFSSISSKAKTSAMEVRISSNTWKKVLLIPGSDGGSVYWRVVGTRSDNAKDTSPISSILIEAAREVETPNTSPPSKGSLPVLSWSNQCNKKFKVWYGNDIQFSKKKSFSFNLTTLSDIFSKALTSSQWNSIRKLVGDAAGETIYWYVESWDGLGRYATTDVMSFVLTE